MRGRTVQKTTILQVLGSVVQKYIILHPVILIWLTGKILFCAMII